MLARHNTNTTAVVLEAQYSTEAPARSFKHYPSMHVCDAFVALGRAQIEGPDHLPLQHLSPPILSGCDCRSSNVHISTEHWLSAPLASEARPSIWDTHAAPFVTAVHKRQSTQNLTVT